MTRPAFVVGQSSSTSFGPGCNTSTSSSAPSYGSVRIKRADLSVAIGALDANPDDPLARTPLYRHARYVH